MKRCILWLVLIVMFTAQYAGCEEALNWETAPIITKAYAQVEFQLETGRKNQIRVHAADLGHPVAGDEKYGAETDPARRLALHAATLVFRNPFSGKMVRCSSPLPEVLTRLN